MKLKSTSQMMISPTASTFMGETYLGHLKFEDIEKRGGAVLKALFYIESSGGYVWEAGGGGEGGLFSSNFWEGRKNCPCHAGGV